VDRFMKVALPIFGFFFFFLFKVFRIISIQRGGIIIETE